MIRRTPLKPVAHLQIGLPLEDTRPRPAFHYDVPGWDDRLLEAKVDAIVRQGFRLPPNPYPLLKGYNGATGQERRNGGEKWKIAKLHKVVPWPTVCSVCLSRKNVQDHNENYFRPLYARPVCSHCHRLLHRRFFDPNPWLAVAHANQHEGAWFRKISLHPLTREQAQLLATFDNPIDVHQLM